MTTTKHLGLTRNQTTPSQTPGLLYAENIDESFEVIDDLEPVSAKKAFGVVADGETDVIERLNEMSDEVDPGSWCQLPEGLMVTSEVWALDKSRNLHISGRGGQANTGQHDSDRGPIPAGSVIQCLGNAPGLWVHDPEKLSGSPAKYSDIPSRHSIIHDFVLWGDRDAGNGQHGLVIDNRGTHAHRIGIAEMGRHAVVALDMVGSGLSDITAYYCRGNAFLGGGNAEEDGSGLDATDQVEDARSASEIVRFHTLLNDGAAIRLLGGVEGLVFRSPIFEKNARAFQFGDVGSTGPKFVKNCHIYDAWDEANTVDPGRFELNARGNSVHYLHRTTTGSVFHAVSYNKNLVSGFESGDADNMPFEQIFRLQAAGGDDSSDSDWTGIWSRSGTGGSWFMSDRLLLTWGRAVAKGAKLADLGIPSTGILNSPLNGAWKTYKFGTTTPFDIIGTTNANDVVLGNGLTRNERIRIAATLHLDTLGAPDAMQNNDAWTDGSDFFMRLGGTTYKFTKTAV